MEKLKIFNCPYHFGQPRKGVAQSPGYLTELHFLDALKSVVPIVESRNLKFRDSHEPLTRSLVKDAKANSTACHLISDSIIREPLDDSFILCIGGDHGLALGSIHGVISRQPDTIIVWADAHGDVNTPSSSPSGNFHGMPLAFLLGLAKNETIFSWVKTFLAPQKLIYIGPRDLDSGELEIIRELNIQYYSSKDVNREGSKTILEKALKIADPESRCKIHLSFDVDIFDLFTVVSTGTRVSDGPSIQEVFSIGKYLASTGRLRSMDIVELNPEIGNKEEVLDSFKLVIDFACQTLSLCLLHSMNENKKAVA
jgi:arginase